MSLNWFGVTLVCWWLLQMVCSIAIIGHHREPITPGGAIFSVAVHVALLWGLLTVGTVHS